jgi:Fe-S cluster assembly ATP-binding protein
VKWRTEDGAEILKGIDLTVETGKLTVVTGPNGGGKTSLAKVIAGVVPVSEGQILLDDIDITEKDITERAKLGIAYAFQQPVRFKGITVRDLMEIAHGGKMDEQEICEIMNHVGICTMDYIDREVNSSLSGGEIKRIEIASVLARKDVSLYIFDEPEAGIDLWSFTGLVETFRDLKKEQNKTIVLISHQERLLETADNIIVVADGRVRVAGPGSEILPQLLADEKEAAECPIGNLSAFATARKNAEYAAQQEQETAGQKA